MHFKKEKTMHFKSIILGALILAATLPCLSLTGASTTSSYTLFGRELAGIRAGATTCWVRATIPCPVASLVCPPVTQVGVPCPGTFQIQKATTAQYVLGFTSSYVLLGQVSYTGIPSIVCITRKICTTSASAGSSIVCLTPGTEIVDFWLSQFVPTGTTCTPY
jgi:hypothetical protein